MSPNVTDSSWLSEPEKLESVIESCRSEMTSDRLLSRFYLQLRYARPSGDIISSTGAVQVALSTPAIDASSASADLPA